MVASGSVIFGTILNKPEIKDRKTGDVAANTTLKIGLVYQDGSNGWKNPVATAIQAAKLYWNDIQIDNSSGAKGDKFGTFYGEGAVVVGEGTGAIPVDGFVKQNPSATKGNGLITLPDLTSSATNAQLAAFVNTKFGIYKGHIGEIQEINNDPTAAATTEQNLIIEVVRN